MGLRNPCAQLDGFCAGLMQVVLARDAQGSLVRKADVMSIVRRGGVVRPGGPTYFSSLSISSMTLFISLIEARNGAEVVMFTPAPLSRSIGYLELPEDNILR